MSALPFCDFFHIVTERETVSVIIPYRKRRSLLQAVDTAVMMVRNGDNGIPVPDYGDLNVSTKVVKLIQSYTGVVNKMVWRKY